MFRNVLRIAEVAQNVVAKVASQNPRPRFFHATSALKKVDVVTAKIPQSLQEKISAKPVDDSKLRSRNIIIPFQELRERSEDLWKFLLQEASRPDAEAQLLIEAIKEFRKGNIDPNAPQIMKLENPLPKIDAKSGERFLVKENITAALRKTTKDEMLQKAKEQALNLDLLQMIFCLCGLRVFNKERNFLSYAPLFLSDENATQAYHCDGGVEQIDSKIFAPKVTANAFLAVQRDLRFKVSTDFIKIDDIVKKLNPDTLKILQEPNFIAEFPDSKSASKIPHPLLQLKNNVWTLLYPNGVVSAFIDKEKTLSAEEVKEIEVRRNAVMKFETVIKEMEKDEVFSIELLADSKGNPNELLLFNNSRLVHRREVSTKSLTDYYLNPFCKNREAISLIAGQSNSGEMGNVL